MFWFDDSYKRIEIVRHDHYIDMPTDRFTDRQTGRQTDRQTGIQTDMQTGIHYILD